MIPHPPSLQAAVALQAYRGESSIADIACRYCVTEDQVIQWRDRLVQGATSLFSSDESAAKEHAGTIEPDELAHTIAENSSQGIAMVDARGVCIYANRTWLQMTGYTAEEIGAKPLHDLVHHHYPDGRPFPLHECPVNRAIPDNSAAQTHEDLFFRKDGSSFHVACSASPVFRNGQPVATVVEIRDISERKRIEKERQHFVSIAEQSTDFIGMADTDLRLFYMNPAGLAMVGLDSQEEALQVPVSGYFFPEDQAFIVKNFLPTVMANGHAEVEIRFRHFKTGDAVWMIYSVYTLFDETGKVIGYATVSKNITERRRARQRLEASEEQAAAARVLAETESRRLDALLQAAPVGIIYFDSQGANLLSNAENRKIWGDYPIARNVGEYEEWKAWWPKGSEREGQPLAADEWPAARVLTGEDASEKIIDIQPFGQPGVRSTILARATPIRDADGNVTGAVVAQMDITQQVQAQAALRESEARFRTIADAMPQMVWSTLPDGYHDYYNERWYDYTGVPRGSTDGEAWSGIFHPEDQANAWDLWQQSLSTGEPYEIHYRLRHWSGEYRWVLGRALPIRDDAGKIIRWMGTCTDIHDQKLAEESLKTENRRKDEFLAMLAHELRNPLAPIGTAAEILKIPHHDPQRIMHCGDIIARQVRHMTKLVDDLLDVSRVTRGQVHLRKEMLSVKSVVNSAIEQARPLIDARGHALTTKMVSEDLQVAGDRTRLVQVIANLLNNAAKYTPESGEIALSVEVVEKHVRIVVRDNGVGIDAALLPHVFELFTQAERTSDRSQGGLGLGLALVKSIMSLHGGHVEAHSTGLGHGSTFCILLPLTEKQDGNQEGVQHGPGRVSPASALRVMIVDDNVDAAEMLAAVFEYQGHEVSVRHAAQDALAEALGNPPQLFILDIGLPGMNGNDLARRLRSHAQTAQATLIALTGYGQAHDRDATQAAGFDHHFVKPVDVGQLLDIASSLTSSSA